MSEEDSPLNNKEQLMYIVADAMMVLVASYHDIPPDELEGTLLSYNAATMCEILELLMAYVGKHENIDLDKMMEAATMEMQATVMDSTNVRLH